MCKFMSFALFTIFIEKKFSNYFWFRNFGDLPRRRAPVECQRKATLFSCWSPSGRAQWETKMNFNNFPFLPAFRSRQSIWATSCDESEFAQKSSLHQSEDPSAEVIEIFNFETTFDWQRAASCKHSKRGNHLTR